MSIAGGRTKEDEKEGWASHFPTNIMESDHPMFLHPFLKGTFERCPGHFSQGPNRLTFNFPGSFEQRRKHLVLGAIGVSWVWLGVSFVSFHQHHFVQGPEPDKKCGANARRV